MASPAELREVARYRVIYGDTDQMGMVYYGNYLRYFEIARNEFLRGAGAEYRAFEAAHGLRLPVVEATRQLPQAGPLRRRAGAARRGARDAGRVGPFRLRDPPRLPDGELLATGHTVHACVDARGPRRPPPEPLRAALSARGARPRPPRAPGT